MTHASSADASCRESPATYLSRQSRSRRCIGRCAASELTDTRESPHAVVRPVRLDEVRLDRRLLGRPIRHVPRPVDSRDVGNHEGHEVQAVLSALSHRGRRRRGRLPRRPVERRRLLQVSRGGDAPSTPSTHDPQLEADSRPVDRRDRPGAAGRRLHPHAGADSAAERRPRCASRFRIGTISRCTTWAISSRRPACTIA